jgi:hypothetical protein
MNRQLTGFRLWGGTLASAIALAGSTVSTVAFDHRIEWLLIPGCLLIAQGGLLLGLWLRMWSS